MNEFVFVQGLKGPEGQLWREPQVTGGGQPQRSVLFSTGVDGMKSLDYYIQLYKENVIGQNDF